MKRKLYALLILIGTLGALLLVYLYFFVYYTGNLTINSNVENYTVELFSPGTTQKWIHECLENICIIDDVSPFNYNISIRKQDYKTEVFSYKVRPRGRETLVVQLEKQVQLDLVNSEKREETAKEKIQRLRDENLYYAIFRLSDKQYIRFKEDESELLLQYIANNEVKDIQKFQKVSENQIRVENIYSSQNLFLALGDDSYIFDTDFFRLTAIPPIKDISYIKYDSITRDYIIITTIGAFTYNLVDNNLEYQYLFKDYVNTDTFTIGIIFSDEEQKRKNFNLTQNGNLIVRYSQEDKQRKVIYASGDNIDAIYQKGDAIFIVSGQREFELKNFD